METIIYNCMEHEDDDETNCFWYHMEWFQKVWKKIGGIRNQRKNRNNPVNNSKKNGANTKKSP